ncbi:hypothetical protein ASG98_26210 [Bacillus sp. Soil531]|nr:hypothetical protein ASG98_26210 [Bacillus sp. Soil531]
MTTTDYYKQTGRGSSKQRKMGRASNLSQDIDQFERAYALAKTIDEICMHYGKNSVIQVLSHLNQLTACYLDDLIEDRKK